MLTTPNAKVNIFIEMTPSEFVINNGNKSRACVVSDMSSLHPKWLIQNDGYIGLSGALYFHCTLPGDMDKHIQHIQTIIDESLREVALW